MQDVPVEAQDPALPRRFMGDSKVNREYSLNGINIEIFGKPRENFADKLSVIFIQGAASVADEGRDSCPVHRETMRSIPGFFLSIFLLARPLLGRTMAALIGFRQRRSAPSP